MGAYDRTKLFGPSLGARSLEKPRMTVDRIYLIGFMGAGKSTVGRELALQLQWPFFDLDLEIQKAEGMPVRAIFEQKGEPRFRELEAIHLNALSHIPNAVIALGGGAYIDPVNRELVEATGLSVWLDTPLSILQERVRPDGNRPLWASPEKVLRLYDQRQPTYQLARLRIPTENRLPDSIAEEIIRKARTL